MKHSIILKNLLCGISVLLLPVMHSCNNDVQRNVSETAERAPVSKAAEFKGDVYEYIAGHTAYPANAVTNGKEGNVLVYFNVDESGVISDAKTVSGGADAELVQAALDCITAMPAWEPAEQNGKKVKSKSHLVFSFRLSPDKPIIAEKLTDEEFERGLAKMQQDLAEMRKNMQTDVQNDISADEQRKIDGELKKILSGQAKHKPHMYITPGSAQKA